MRLTGAEKRPGLAKVGRGARGACGDGGPRSAMRPAPRSAGTNPAEHHPRGRILVEAGERQAVPSRPNRTGTGPAGGIPGGAGGVGHRGSDARVPRVRGPARGRLGGLQGCGWGGGRAELARGRTPRGLRGLGEGPRGRPLLGGGRGLLPARGTTGAPLELEGGGRVSPCVGPCRFMAARHGTVSPTLRAGVRFGRGGGVGGGGGGWRLSCAPSLVGGGGFASRAPSGVAEK